MNQQSQQTYRSLGLDRLSPDEKLALGCLLVESALPEMKRIPPSIAEEIWTKLYQAESIVKITQTTIDTQLTGELESRLNGSLESALALLGEALGMVDRCRMD